jgi:hypothetical protein
MERITTMRRFFAIVAAVIVVGGIAAGALFTLSRSDFRMWSAAAGRSVATCPSVAPKVVGMITVPAGPIAGYCQDRLVNAAQVINAARALGIGPHTQAIGVMTAMGESGLRNLDHGDAAGADSRGLFQQRANGAWGTLDDRMTPSTAAHNFFAALVLVPGWKTLTPTQAAHSVQINADADFYTYYWSDAVTVVTTLTGTAVPTG